MFPKHQRNKYIQHQKLEKQNKFSRQSSPLLTRQVDVRQEEDETQFQMLETQHSILLYRVMLNSNTLKQRHKVKVFFEYIFLSFYLYKYLLQHTTIISCIVSSYMNGRGLGGTLTGTLKREHVPACVFAVCILILEQWIFQKKKKHNFLSVLDMYR